MKLKVIVALCFLAVGAVDADSQSNLKKLAEQVVIEANDIANQIKSIKETEMDLNNRLNALRKTAEPLGDNVYVKPYGRCGIIPNRLEGYIQSLSNASNSLNQLNIELFHTSLKECREEIATDPDYVDPNIAILDVWSDTQ